MSTEKQDKLFTIFSKIFLILAGILVCILAVIWECIQTYPYISSSIPLIYVGVIVFIVCYRKEKEEKRKEEEKKRKTEERRKKMQKKEKKKGKKRNKNI